MPAIVSGLIIDTFSEMRAESDAIKEDMDNVCFICNIKRDDFETLGISFAEHCATEHNPEFYVFFHFYLNEKVTGPSDALSLSLSPLPSPLLSSPLTVSLISPLTSCLQDPNDYTGQEHYVQRCIQSRQISFFPLKKAKQIEGVASGGGGRRDVPALHTRLDALEERLGAQADAAARAQHSAAALNERLQAACLRLELGVKAIAEAGGGGGSRRHGSGRLTAALRHTGGGGGGGGGGDGGGGDGGGGEGGGGGGLDGGGGCGASGGEAGSGGGGSSGGGGGAGGGGTGGGGGQGSCSGGSSGRFRGKLFPSRERSADKEPSASKSERPSLATAQSSPELPLTFAQAGTTFTRCVERRL